MLGTKYLGLLYSLAAFHVYTTDGLTFSDGTTLIKTFNHDTAALTTFTVMTDTAALFTLTGTDSGDFSVAPTTLGTASTTATVTITNKLNYNSKTTYSFTISATETTNTATIAITLNVVKPVVFAMNTYSAKVCETATVDTNVHMVTATKDTSKIITYTIESAGNTGTKFKISASGQIQTAKATVKTDGPAYSLTVKATDNSSPTQSDTTSVTVIVCGSCSSGASTVTGSVAAMLCLLLSVFKKLV